MIPMFKRLADLLYDGYSKGKLLMGSKLITVHGNDASGRLTVSVCGMVCVFDSFRNQMKKCYQLILKLHKLTRINQPDKAEKQAGASGTHAEFSNLRHSLLTRHLWVSCST